MVEVGVALVLVGVALLVAEAHVPGGALGALGGVALVSGIALAVEAWGWHARSATWQTLVFTTLCFMQLGHVLAIRSEQTSLFSQGLLSNTPLLGAVMLTVLLQLVVVYVPALNPIFATVPLSAPQLATAFSRISRS